MEEQEVILRDGHVWSQVYKGRAASAQHGFSVQSITMAVGAKEGRTQSCCKDKKQIHDDSAKSLKFQ